MKELSLVLLMSGLIVLMRAFLSFHSLTNHFYNLMELHWARLVVFLVEDNMLCMRDHLKKYHLDLPMDLWLALIKTLYLDLLIVNLFVLHFELKIYRQMGLIMELILVVFLDPLMALMKSVLRFHCLVTQLYEIKELH